ncbi:hypothetical protein VNO78_02592 [Psophocarpus tetragonolobus]|uniref:Uncharacterized protein n=1 Tax=Psophocarpus tetragonolobus TaxID=3891 RepID=A0AAN9T0L5_PSOTE
MRLGSRRTYFQTKECKSAKLYGCKSFIGEKNRHRYEGPLSILLAQLWSEFNIGIKEPLMSSVPYSANLSNTYVEDRENTYALKILGLAVPRTIKLKSDDKETLRKKNHGNTTICWKCGKSGHAKKNIPGGETSERNSELHVSGEDDLM